MKVRIGFVFLAMIVSLALVAPAADAHDPGGDQAEALKGRLYDGRVEDPSPGGVPMEAISGARCKGGVAAGIFPCHKVDLDSFTPLTDVEATFVNDVWGWQDPVSGMQVAIVGSFEGTIFMDVTDGVNPVYLGTLPSPVPDDFRNIWGDIRVHENTAYIGSEAVDFDGYFQSGVASGHGVQVVDLTQFRGRSAPFEITETARLTDMTNSHNLSLNPETERLYVTGSVFFLNECSTAPYDDIFNGEGGSIVYDVSNPNHPVFEGCLDADGYNHDIQCVVYHGPDREFQGREICIGSNEDALTIYEVSDLDNEEILASVKYLDFDYWPDPEAGPPSYYTHQGWLSEDHSYFFLGDELDEYSSGFPRTTYIWDFADLRNPQVIEAYSDGNESIDHNMFVHRGLLYQSNYTSGLWIYDAWKADKGRLTMRGFFDVFPIDDRTDFFGTWGNYPYFGDGKVIVTSSDEGIFVLNSRAKSSNNTFSNGRR